MTGTARETRCVTVANGRICYDAQGTGPVLLLIPGGPVDATAFTRLAPLLASDYRVVTYDPLGLSRSSINRDIAEISVDKQATHAARLLAEVTTESAYVFASCGGGNTGLALTTNFPEQVRAMVVHEPPCIELLPDAARHRAAFAAMSATFRDHGAGPAVKQMVEYFGWDNDPRLSGTDATAPEHTNQDEKRGNNELFFAKMFGPVLSYLPDITSLSAAKTPLVVAGGQDSHGQLAFHAATMLAESLAIQLTYFPGGHGGFLHQPEEFAHTLRATLTNPQEPPAIQRSEPTRRAHRG